jgi:Rrf2 family protein
VQVSLKADYALRALAELAARTGGPGERAVPLAELAEAQGIPGPYLRSILAVLSRGGLIRAQGGPGGGYRFRRPPERITLAEVLVLLEGPIALVGVLQPADGQYHGASASMSAVWQAVQRSLCAVLEGVTVADVAQARVEMALHGRPPTRYPEAQPAVS